MKETVAEATEMESIKTVPYDSLRNATYVHDSEFFDLTGCMNVQELINHLLNEGMIDNKFSDACRTSAVEVNRSHRCRVVQQEEIAVYSREHSHERQWRDAESDVTHTGTFKNESQYDGKL